jgi:hypothetical protein
MHVEPGYVKGRLYVNRSLGLTFARPSTLRFVFRPTEISEKTFVLVKAVGKDEPNHLTPVIVLAAESLSGRPKGDQTPLAYLKMLIADRKEEGYSLKEAEHEFQVGDQQLLRADLKKGPIFEAVLVTTHKGFALVLIAINVSERELDSMIRSSALSLRN